MGEDFTLVEKILGYRQTCPNNNCGVTFGVIGFWEREEGGLSPIFQQMDRLNYEGYCPYCGTRMITNG